MPVITTTDQMGRHITLPDYPQRIVSLVPSQTEFLVDIGLEDRLVGITRFCIHPKGLTGRIATIGGTKRFDFDVLDSLQPDLIIGNKEENYAEGIARLEQRYPVWMSDIVTIADALAMMNELGCITDKQEQAQSITNAIQLKPIPSVAKAAYFIWRKPYMVAANGTFINEMLGCFGVENVFNNLERYPEVTLEDLTTAKPDFIFLSSEPYAFGEKHYEEFQQVCPQAKVVLVDGEMFSWYGSRLRLANAYFTQLRQQLGIAR